MAYNNVYKTKVYHYKTIDFYSDTSIANRSNSIQINKSEICHPYKKLYRHSLNISATFGNLMGQSVIESTPGLYITVGLSPASALYLVISLPYKGIEVPFTFFVLYDFTHLYELALFIISSCGHMETS